VQALGGVDKAKPADIYDQMGGPNSGLTLAQITDYFKRYKRLAPEERAYYEQHGHAPYQTADRCTRVKEGDLVGDWGR
jgi:hypothetical protein